MKFSFSKNSKASKAVLFTESDEYFKFYLQLIDSAKVCVHLQTYIFELDSFGLLVHQACLRAASRGVKVFLLMDSVGSRDLDREEDNRLRAVGVDVQRFNDIQWSWLYRWGRRLHHKVLVVDGKSAIVGGINVTNSGYFPPLIEHQLDFAVHLEGPVCAELASYCNFVFSKSDKPVAPGLRQGFDFANANANANAITLKIFINDWVFLRWQITRQYSQITKTAKKEIIILNSYFFPRRRFMRQLAKAAKRGVRVRLILPRLSDWPSSILASQYLYNYFLRQGIEIYEWKKSVLHGKIATVDGRHVTIGSFNLHYTSYQQNLEMNVDFDSTKFCEVVNARLNAIMAEGCDRVEAKDFNSSADLKTKGLRFMYYLLYSLLAGLSVMLTYQEPGRKPQRDL